MERLSMIFATAFGIGYFPFMPGTIASILAAILLLYIDFSIIYIIMLVCLGVFICGKAERYFPEKDSPNIVFDEFCGMFIAGFALNDNKSIIFAFLLFRLLDIFKPFPINRSQNLPGGVGIMADDILAGLITRLVIMIIF